MMKYMLEIQRWKQYFTHHEVFYTS